jgi:hypothetical protein
MRSKKSSPDKKIASDICGRFVDLLTLLPGSLRSKSVVLGYDSPSTIYAVKKGTVLPDLIKLSRLAGQEEQGQRPNIDWLVTGRGKMMIPKNEEGILEKEVIRRVMGQPQDKLEAILVLLEKKG